MAKEIERKFLVQNENWRPGATVRVRVMGEQGFLTIKGRQQGITRSEFEYPISLEDANALLDEFCPGPLVEKVRYERDFAGLTWEIDEFFGENDGLIVAEVELQDAYQIVALPEWIGREVSDDPRYRNASLAKQPFSRWGRRTT